MISERKFAVSYTSLWREITPSADNFLRHINLTSERFSAPYTSLAPPFLNGAINETAFRLSRSPTDKILRKFKVSSREGRTIWGDVCRWLGEEPVGRYQLTRGVWLDILAIAENIYVFLAKYDFLDVIFEPKFLGCGVISQCTGDIVVGKMLVEVKAGARGFRVTDLRQLLIYCALARVAGVPQIENVCLMNPRWGVSWVSSLEDVATSCGASSVAELLEDVTRGAVLLGVSN